MNWEHAFAPRAARMQRSVVRDLLRLTARPDMISFAGGLPAPELFPLDEFRRAAAQVLRDRGPEALQYGETEGVGELRDWIADAFSRPALRLARANVLITSGSQQALDLIGRVLLDAGDAVAVESPTYLAALAAWRPLGVKFLCAPSDADGMRVEALDSLDRERPKLVYVVPNFQNPQGTTLSQERRARLAAWLRERSVPCVEDNPYGELRYEGEPLPHLFALNATMTPGGALAGNVIHTGTFSKVLAPGLRVGWVVAPEPVIEVLTRAKQAADLQTSTLNQFLALELVRGGVLERQLPVLRAAYRARRDAMLAALARHFPPGAAWTRPSGGLFLMVTLPGDRDARELLKAALARNVAFVPGEEFHPDGSGRATLRLNFSHPSPERIEEGIQRLAAAMR